MIRKKLKQEAQEGRENQIDNYDQVNDLQVCRRECLGKKCMYSRRTRHTPLQVGGWMSVMPKLMKDVNYCRPRALVNTSSC